MDWKKAHVAWNLLLELHLELRRWSTIAHVPRRIATRLDQAALSASISIGLAAHKMRMEHHLRHARDRVLVCGDLIEEMNRERHLSPHLHRWAKQKMAQILDELERFDPEKWEPIGTPPPPLPPRVVN
jgi:hypothetical protein